MRDRLLCLMLIIQVLLVCSLSPGSTADSCEPWMGKMVSVQGLAEVKRSGSSRWQPIELNGLLCAGDTLHIHERSRAAIVFQNGAMLRLNHQTSITFTPTEKEKSFLLELVKGAVYFISRLPRTLKVMTPFVNAAVEGTEFMVRVDKEQTLLSVFEGSVVAENPAGQLLLSSGESAIATADCAPISHLVALSLDTVQWALYYPPVLETRPDTAPATIRDSVYCFTQGDVKGAFSFLDDLPSERRDVAFYLYGASLFLYVGRVENAQGNIRQALNMEPANGLAFALQSIIDVTQNKKEEALLLAQKAIDGTPDSIAPYISLSYAYQAFFELGKALESMYKAVKVDPENALAWARLAELQLSRGDLDKATESAEKAATLNPRLARTQSVLGYAYLSKIDIAKAKNAFEKAITFDQADPLPILGLGLVEIHRGEIEKGRGMLEIAASLDLNNALIRSYLGKAYYEEKRGDLADSQYIMAKMLDPDDPTPWFYDAIGKQASNRPVEALTNIRKSIELNDNRAVYRSRLLMDKDYAARSSSLGGIFRNLGFEQLALLEGSKSIITDPGNYSGHRFLADSYSDMRRHEIARVSELLQSQLLQPINITPIQPHLAVSDLFVPEGAGPADAGFNEFTPLFMYNRSALHVSGVFGSHETIGDEIVHSGLRDKWAYSLGQYHFETEGFRANNDIKHDIYNAYIQKVLSHKSSIQAEYIYQDTESGDLRLRFDPNSYAPNDRRYIDRHTGRLGFHYQPSARQEMLLSAIYRDRSHELSETYAQFIPGASLIGRDSDIIDGTAYSIELLYLHRFNRANLIIGGCHFDEDATFSEVSKQLFTIDPDPPVTLVDATSQDFDSRHVNAYAYTTIKVRHNLSIIPGVAYDDYDSKVVDHDELSPKFGFIWEFVPSTTLRGAWFKTIKRPFAANQTIEPTQVAGFNQFFDDINGSKTKRYGIALEHELTHGIFSGIEWSRRELDIPIILPDQSASIFEDQDEKLHRAYFYWAITQYLAFSGEYFIEKFYREKGSPHELSTHKMPLGINYYSPHGFISQLKAYYADQEITDNDCMDEDSFWVVDWSMAYRLKKRHGIVRLSVKNLFDESFHFHDVNFNTGEPLIPFFQPTRYILLQFTLAI
ncbi:MAG: TonB-dependent receptor domain-containing protein [bacterium]